MWSSSSFQTSEAAVRADRRAIDSSDLPPRLDGAAKGHVAELPQIVTLRRAAPDRSLTSLAHTWLAKLPPRYQPLSTVRLHPHIVNRLTQLWQDTILLNAYFHELLLGTRKGRAGFSLGVLTELTDLQTLARDADTHGVWAQSVGALGSTCIRQQMFCPPERKAFRSCELFVDQRR